MSDGFAAFKTLVSAFERLPHGHFLKALTITHTELGEYRVTVCNSQLHSGSVVGADIEDCAEQLLAIFGEKLAKIEPAVPAKPRRKLF